MELVRGLADLVNRLTRGFTRDEYEKYVYSSNRLKSFLDKPSQRLEREINLGVCRDIQAQRLPPNTAVPSRLRHPVEYLKLMHSLTGDTLTTLSSYLTAGSWTSSGGSFKLAENHNIDLRQYINDAVQRNGNAVFLEIGAGYAGMATHTSGIGKLADDFTPSLGKEVEIHFSNLTKWHDSLPVGVYEHAGLCARDISRLREQDIDKVDVVYSQAATYFETELPQFIHSISSLLNIGGRLVFNYPDERDDELRNLATRNGLELERTNLLGGCNGRLYVFEKVSDQSYMPETSHIPLDRIPVLGRDPDNTVTIIEPKKGKRKLKKWITLSLATAAILSLGARYLLDGPYKMDSDSFISSRASLSSDTADEVRREFSDYLRESDNNLTGSIRDFTTSYISEKLDFHYPVLFNGGLVRATRSLPGGKIIFPEKTTTTYFERQEEIDVSGQEGVRVDCWDYAELYSHVFNLLAEEHNVDATCFRVRGQKMRKLPFLYSDHDFNLILNGDGTREYVDPNALDTKWLSQPKGFIEEPAYLKSIEQRID